MTEYIYNPQTYFYPKIQFQAGNPYHSNNLLIWINSIRNNNSYDTIAVVDRIVYPAYPKKMRLSGHAATAREFRYTPLNYHFDHEGIFYNYNIALSGKATTICSYPTYSPVIHTAEYNLSGSWKIDTHFIYPTTGSAKFDVFFFFLDDNPNVGTPIQPWILPDQYSSIQSTPTNYNRDGIPTKYEDVRSNKIVWFDNPSGIFGKGNWVTASQYVQFNNFYSETYLWKNLSPVTDQATFKIKFNSSLINKFRESTKDVYCYITKNYQSYFYGVVQKNWITKSSIKMDWIDVTVADLGDALKTDIRTLFTVPTGMNIIDTTGSSSMDAPSCVIDCLLSNYLNGKNSVPTYILNGKLIKSFPAYTVSDAAIVNLNRPLENGMTVTVDDKKEYYETLSSILQDYGCCFRFDEGGIMQIFTIKEILNGLATFNFNNQNMYDSLGSEKKEPQYEGASITYNKVMLDSESIVYKETSGGGTVYDCLFAIPVASGLNWYPISKSGTTVVEQTISVSGLDDDKLLAIKSPRFVATILTNGNLVTTLSGTIPYFNNYSKASMESFTKTFSTTGWKVMIGQVGPKTFVYGVSNTTGNAVVSLTSFRIYGQISHTSDSYVSSKLYDSTTNKIYTDTLDWCHDLVIASEIANQTASYYWNADYTYTLSSDTNVPVGTVVYLSDTNEPLVNRPCVVTSRKIKEYDGYYQYELEGLDDLITHDEMVSYEPSVDKFESPLFEMSVFEGMTGDEADDTEVIYRPKPVNLQVEQLSSSLYKYPTKSEAMVDGWIDDVATNIPSPPAVYGKVSYRNIFLFWDRQTNLTNLSHYEVQVMDEGKWYNPLNTDSYIGTEGTNTPVYTEAFQHVDIPWLNDANRSLYYRVRAVTNTGVTSDWSNVVGFTTFKVRSEDLQNLYKEWNMTALNIFSGSFSFTVDRELSTSGSLILSGINTPVFEKIASSSGTFHSSGHVVIDSIDRAAMMNARMNMSGSPSYFIINPFSQAFTSASIASSPLNCKVSSTKSVIYWKNSNVLKIQSGTSLSQYNFTASSPVNVQMRFIEENKFIIFYYLSTLGVKAKIATLDGNNLSLSDQIDIDGHDSYYVSDIKNNKFVYSYSSSVDGQWLIIVDVSSGLSIGSAKNVYVKPSYYPSKCVWIDTDKLVLTYINDQNKLLVGYASVSGSTFTVDTAYESAEVQNDFEYSLASSSPSEFFIAATENGYNIQIMKGDISGRIINTSDWSSIGDNTFVPSNIIIKSIDSSYAIESNNFYGSQTYKTIFYRFDGSNVLWYRVLYTNNTNSTFCYLGNGLLHETHEGYITSTIIY